MAEPCKKGKRLLQEHPVPAEAYIGNLQITSYIGKGLPKKMFMVMYKNKINKKCARIKCHNVVQPTFLC